MISDEGFKKACTILLDPRPVGDHTRLLPETVLEDVLVRINGEADQCGLTLGKGLLDRLATSFPAYDKKAHKRYLESLVELFSVNPLSCCNGAIARLMQLAEFPSTGDVLKELKFETERRNIVRSAAIAQQREREQRMKTAQAEDEFRQAQIPLEERKRIVAKVLGPKHAD